MGETKHLDSKDIKIINAVMQNSRKSLRQIAAKVKCSVATVMHRLRELEKNNIIKGYTAQLDYDKLGYDIEVIITIRVSKGKLIQVEKKIASHPNVWAVYDTTGPSDIFVIARFPNRRSMDAFLKKIQTFDFVERTSTSLVLNTIKEEPFLVK